MKQIQVNIQDTLGTINIADLRGLDNDVADALTKLHNHTGEGNDYHGWLDLPTRTPQSLIDEINAVAADLRRQCQIVVCIGIGGSYLGAKAVISALDDTFACYDTDKTQILFAGQNISQDYLYDLCKLLQNKQFGIIVISKSGTTTEPAIAFRLLRELLEKQVGKDLAASRIVAITDARRGALRTLADKQGYKTFVIEDTVGGRFSVLSPVGLLPIAVAGYDIQQLLTGAADMQRATVNANATNPAAIYAATRNALYRKGKKIEILVNYDPRLHFLAEWWKQLYGESEGKQHRGIFPAAVDNTTDLHSMGQWIQDGERTIFETVITVDKPHHELTIPRDDENLDALNYIAGKQIDQVNKMAELGTRLAHIDGGVPNINITIEQVDAYNIGALIYFFEKACGISGYILGVNPFNQPGVEDYKRNMFALLEKPGYEDQTQQLKQRLQQK